MHAEANLPVGFVVDEARKGIGIRREQLGISVPRRAGCTPAYATWECSAIELHIGHVKTHIEVLRHVPLRSGTDPPLSPVHVAARGCDRVHALPSAVTVGAAKECVG